MDISFAKIQFVEGKESWVVENILQSLCKKDLARTLDVALRPEANYFIRPNPPFLFMKVTQMVYWLKFFKSVIEAKRVKIPNSISLN